MSDSIKETAVQGNWTASRGIRREMVMEMLRAQLAIEAVDLTASFFSNGGSSLGAVAFIHELRRTTRVVLSPQRLMFTPLNTLVDEILQDGLSINESEGAAGFL